MSHLEKLFFLCSLLASIKGYSSHENNCNVSIEDSECQPWYYATDYHNKCASFGKSYGKIIQKETSGTTLLQFGYCMTYINGTSYTIACPYDVADNHLDLVAGQGVLLNTTLGELHNFTCAQFHRESQHCSQCESNYGPSVFTMDFGCYSCSSEYSGWAIYLFMEFILLSFFTGFLLVLRLSPTRPDMKGFVLFSQIVMLSLSANFAAPYKHIYKSKAMYIVKIIKTCYGFWNLDFFRSLIPPFCVDKDLNNLEVLAFYYISAVYPMVLTVIAWIVVDLHERQCKLLVRLWKPFQSYLSHYSVTNNPKRIIVSFFATITILSYTKIVYISASLLTTTIEYQVCDTSEHKLYFQPEIHYFGQKHIPFVILALLMLLSFVITPVLILLLYSIEHVQNKLKSTCVKQKNIQTFVEVFQECYKDGTNGTKDCRLFSTVYLFHRIIVTLILVKGMTDIATYLVTAAAHGFVVGLLFYYRPYKQDAYNYLDIMFFSVFGVIFLFSGFIPSTPWVRSVLLTVIFVAMLVPFSYASIRVLRVLIRWFKLIDIKSFLQRRRRGYIEISEYGEEQSFHEARQNNQKDNRQRMAGKDSFQSE